MQFLIIAHDFKDADAINRRLAAREAHIKLGDQLRDKGQMLYGVAILDDSQKMVGSCIVVDFPSRKEVDAWLKVEPYVTGNVWETTEVQPCRVGPSFTRANRL